MLARGRVFTVLFPARTPFYGYMEDIKRKKSVKEITLQDAFAFDGRYYIYLAHICQSAFYTTFPVSTARFIYPYVEAEKPCAPESIRVK